MTYSQVYELVKRANTQQYTWKDIEEAFNAGGQRGGAGAGSATGLIGGGLAGATLGYNLPDWFSKAQKASKLKKILSALGVGVLGAGAGFVAGGHAGERLGEYTTKDYLKFTDEFAL